jgi:small conductance mechanosensitive channel
MNWTSIGTIIQERAASVGLQILGALILYIVGRWLINLLVGAVHRVLTKQKIEPTVMRFAGNALSVALNMSRSILRWWSRSWATSGFRPLHLRR